ncbi:MAG: hypothetical protein MI784_13115, partial [Cytophagales bacterium]|nr:hypothetical protein [Cytophagales bacterium]
MRRIINNRVSWAQHLLMLLVWLIIYALPLQFGDFSNGVDWPHVLKVWKENTVVLLAVLVN